MSSLESSNTADAPQVEKGEQWSESHLLETPGQSSKLENISQQSTESTKDEDIPAISNTLDPGALLAGVLATVGHVPGIRPLSRRRAELMWIRPDMP